jgi:hypothetical protein
MLPPFKNVKGSVIKRGGSIKGHTYKIGKVIGGKVYMHINYMDTLPDPDEARRALNAAGGKKFRTLSYDPKVKAYMFSEAPDFDRVSEPAPGASVKVKVNKDGSMDVDRPKVISQIWHHKWMWVDDNYSGFDVRKSYEWSKKWTAKISSPSGSLRIWKKELNDAGFLYRPVNEDLRFEQLAKEYLNEKNKLSLR